MDEESRTDHITVEHTLLHERLDAFLSEKYPSVSRGNLQRLIKEGHIQVDGLKVKSKHHPKAGEVIRIYFPPPKAFEVEARDIPLDVLFEDEHLIVVNKQAGLLVHIASGEEKETLVNALVHHCEGQLSGIGGVARPGIVHRLDRDTSGCIVSAKHDESHLGLTKQFADREVTKIYHAIACGSVRKKEGEIDAPIARHSNHRMCMVVPHDGGGKDARTSYKVIKYLRETTLVEIKLHTGRTHQIRVHFKHIGFPLAGDDVYAKRQNKHLTEFTGYKAQRQMLHSHILGFTHPISKERIECTAPYPADFIEAMERLAPPWEE
ncbi:RluA family pseudouridine synthase [bacterium]|nr:RluA family pseudouridine synthase [bacterium]